MTGRGGVGRVKVRGNMGDGEETNDIKDMGVRRAISKPGEDSDKSAPCLKVKGRRQLWIQRPVPLV